MSVVVVGIEHHQAPLDVLERVALGDADVAKALRTLDDLANVQETVVLSTCLRTEVYAVVDRFHDAVDEILDVLAGRAGLSASEVQDHCTVRFDDDVALHLFSVAAGLESAVLGESEVLGQVRRAWERAKEERTSGPVLGELFRHAVHAGKRARSETGIARGTTSFSHAAVSLVEGHRDGGLGGTTVVVLGAGEMGAGVTRVLAALPEGRRPAEVVVANRTVARARELVALPAPGVVLRAVGSAAVPTEVGRADVVVTAVDATDHVLTAADLAPDGNRSARPLLVLDLAVPRNVHPAAGELEGVTLLDMDRLRALVAGAVEGRQGEAERVRAIVVDDLARYRAAARARGAAPVVGALRARLEELRAGELHRRRNQFGELTSTAWSEVDAVTRAVLAKLLHEPTVLLKETAGTTRGERLVEALRTLFDL